MSRIDSVKKYVYKAFAIKDLGDLKFFIGLEVTRSFASLNLYERKYILVLLRNISFLGCKLAATHVASSIKLTRDDGSASVDVITYRQLVSKLLYLTNIQFSCTTVISIS